MCAGLVNTGKSSLSFSWGGATAPSWSKAGRHSPLEIRKLSVRPWHVLVPQACVALRAAVSRSLVLQARTRSAQAARDVLKARLPLASEPRGPQHLKASPTTS